MSNNSKSFYDQGQIFKEVHDFHGNALRVSDSRSVVDRFYTHFRVIYNVDNFPTEVTYYRGIKPHKTIVGVLSDVNGSLQNTYIKLFSCPDNKSFHLWFNVDNLGVDPAPENSTGIEVPINSNDDSSVISMAISLVVNTLFNDYFKALRNNSTVEISCVESGVISDSQDFGTGFVLANTSGEQELIKNIKIGYEGQDPVYKGQVLKNYVFNVFSGEFELKEDLSSNTVEVIWDEITTTFPTEHQELHTYKNNGTPVQEVLVTYFNESRNVITSVQKTRLV